MTNYEIKTIAKNIASIWLIINSSQKAQKLTIEKKLFATALLYTLDTINNKKTINVIDVALVVQESQKSSNSIPTDLRLIFLTYHIIALIESKTNNTEYNLALLEPIIKNKVITKSINKTLHKGLRTKLCKSLLLNTLKALYIKPFQELLDSYDEIIETFDLQEELSEQHENEEHHDPFSKYDYFFNSVSKLENLIIKSEYIDTNNKQIIHLEVISLLYFIMDHTVFLMDKENYKPVFKELLFSLSVDTNQLDNRTYLYCMVIDNEIPLRGYLAPTEQIIKEGDVVTQATLLFFDLLLHPECANNYESAPYLIIGLERQFGIITQLYHPVKDIVRSLMENVRSQMNNKPFS